METTKNTLKQIYQELSVPLPKEAVSQHPTKPYLSTINSIYVIERLNQVFGVGKWHVKNEVVKAEGVWVIVKATFEVPEYNIWVFDIFGGNDNKDPGDAYKGACTDALTKIGSYLGIGMDVWKDKVKEGATKQPYHPKAPQSPKTAPSKPVALAVATKSPDDPRKAKIVELMLKIDPGLKGKGANVWNGAVWGRTQLQLMPENYDEITNRLAVLVSEQAGAEGN